MHTIHCRCGEYLGIVTADAKGLCTRCGRSLWMQAAILDTPDSTAIAAQLNNAQAESCLCCWVQKRKNRRDWKAWHDDKRRKRLIAHLIKTATSEPAESAAIQPMRGRVIKTICISVCGVTLRNTRIPFHSLLNPWEVLTPEYRQAWFERQIERNHPKVIEELIERITHLEKPSKL